ncbi:FAD-dependent oxidoreductase [Escherichia coli]
MILARKRAAEELNKRDAYDVLIVGSSPAGAAAAIYSARKGIRTGLMGEHFGGQILDTVDIKNYVLYPKTEGQKLAGALKVHVDEYDVDVIDSQSASKLIPAAVEGGLHQIETASGAVLKARSIIVATGAKWRNMNVPGEDDYRTKGVTYCPHCDGPLFKGKRVAVIGGGNSGVEAAIDLAGIVEHVTLLEFAPEMKADQVLQDKLQPEKRRHYSECANHGSERRRQQSRWSGISRSCQRRYSQHRTGRYFRPDWSAAEHQLARRRSRT